MYKRPLHLIAPVFACLAFALAAPTVASADPVSDCAADGSLDDRYSDAALDEALGNIPADLDEYSDCRSQIEAAKGGGGPKAGIAGPGGLGKEDALADGEGGERGGAGSGAGSGGAQSAQELRRATAARERKRDRARADTEEALGDRRVDTAAGAAVDQADTASGLPLPVLLALIALSLLLAAGAVFALSRRRPGLASALRRVPFRQRRR